MVFSKRFANTAGIHWLRSTNMDPIKKVWFANGKSWECCACRSPYGKDDILTEGVVYEEWIRLETVDNQ